ncbi:MAG TPA: hypothetical protein VMI75_00290 [Polyangiaceae bacterium]|nr:hypothetical protein [Polyangiaceae bacterium]
MRPDEPWGERRRLAMCNDGVIVLSKVLERETEVVVTVGDVWLDGDGSTQPGDRIVEASRRHVSHAEVVENGGVVRKEPGGRQERLDRIRVPALFEQTLGDFDMTRALSPDAHRGSSAQSPRHVPRATVGEPPAATGMPN